jgi:hypothetical protein
MADKEVFRRRTASSRLHEELEALPGIGGVRRYPPAYASIDTLAYLLDLEPAALRAYVRAGVLPAPEVVGRVERWDVAAVFAFIKSKSGNSVSSDGVSPLADPFSKGIKRHGSTA